MVLLFESVTVLLGFRLMSPPPQAAKVAANTFKAKRFFSFMSYSLSRFHRMDKENVNAILLCVMERYLR